MRARGRKISLPQYKTNTDLQWKVSPMLFLHACVCDTSKALLGNSTTCTAIEKDSDKKRKLKTKIMKIIHLCPAGAFPEKSWNNHI